METQIYNNNNLNSLKEDSEIPLHTHKYFEQDNYLICSVCGKKKLNLVRSKKREDVFVGRRDDGKKYSVRSHRKNFFMPDVWNNLMKNLSTEKARFTCEVMINTGARINEARHIEERDIDYERNTLRLRVVKKKGRKSGEDRSGPRTIPISSQFARKLKKVFRTLPPGSSLGNNIDQKTNLFLSTCALNIAIKKTLKKMGREDYYMYSTHNIRKTHGNWLKILGSLRIMNVDAMEICLRLGHDYNTFLNHYGSSSVMDNKDVALAMQILGDLYQTRKYNY